MENHPLYREVGRGANVGLLQVQKSWNPDMEGECLKPGPSFTGYAVVTIVSDIVVALIPIPVLLRLNVSLTKKVGLILIFLLGLFTTLCSIMRYLEIDRVQSGDQDSTMLVLWGVIEFNVGVSQHTSCLFSFELTERTEHGVISSLPRPRLPPQSKGVPQQAIPRLWLLGPHAAHQQIG